MKQTYYEELGVTKNATADQIKRAYRAKAKDIHPDKGGDTAEFVSVAHAYEVLSDPERRLLYDATGADKRPTIEIEVQNTLLQLFNQALTSEQDIEIVATVRNVIITRAEQIPDECKKLKDRRKKLAVKRTKIKSAGVNVAHLIIDQETRSIDAQLANLKHQTAIGKACLTALKAYSEEWEEPASPQIIVTDAFSPVYFRFT